MLNTYETSSNGAELLNSFPELQAKLKQKDIPIKLKETISALSLSIENVDKLKAIHNAFHELEYKLDNLGAKGSSTEVVKVIHNEWNYIKGDISVIQSLDKTWLSKLEAWSFDFEQAMTERNFQDLFDNQVPEYLAECRAHLYMVDKQLKVACSNLKNKYDEFKKLVEK